ncbi:hypothetical protein [Cellulosimicrobium funkei]|uniref:hypothetical protein n=1 Tax=Cellulosimicrobium funkei TaxID=264251 RepID=UPI0034452B8C
MTRNDYLGTIRVRRKTRTVFGRLYVRYTCDRCGRRSGWRAPQRAKNWYVLHGAASTECLVRRPDRTS